MNYRRGPLLEEVKTDVGNTGGGGGDTDLNIDIGAASDAIGADLGLNDSDVGTDDLGSATPPEDGAAKPEAKTAPIVPAKDEKPEEKLAREARERAAAAGKKLDLKPGDPGYVAPEPKKAPKAWKPEMHEHFSKLPPEVQAYVEQREAEVEAGFKAAGEDTRYGKTMKETLAPYEALLTAQGVKDHGFAVKTLMNAHYILSTEQGPKRAEFFARLAKNYGVDLNAAVAAAAASGQQQAEETPAMRELRERTERLENDRRQDLSRQFETLKAQSAAEVEAFASDPAHAYFKEVADEVVLLLQNPKITLEKAYEMAVYANPVTRAKELARLQKDAEEKTRKEAEEKAAAAEKARGTKVKGDERERASPDILGSIEDTMRSTYRNIQNRQE